MTPEVSSTLVLGVTWFVVFLFSTTLHEAAHAFVAYRLGDATAYHGGQVTLNPWPHIQREPFGMVLIPILTFSLNGWMMGWASAPYDPFWAHRHPRRAAAMSFAGPAANLSLALLGGLLIRGGVALHLLHEPERVSFSSMTAATGPGLAGALVAPLSILVSLNLALFVFNLLPLPPLDGSAILPAFLPQNLAEGYQRLLHQPALSLLGLVVAWKLFPPVFDPIQLFALKLLYPGVTYVTG